MILEETYTLSNGVEIPKLGLGTWFISDRDVVQAVKDAARIGYRHFDTAQAYRNERGVGEGIRASGVKREDMFVTTKLAAEVKSYKEAVSAIDQSLQTMGFDYIDMMIIHSPQPCWKFGGEDRYFEGNREAWRALEEAHNAGKLRAIGLSNFEEADIETFSSPARPTDGGSDTGAYQQYTERADSIYSRQRYPGRSSLTDCTRRIAEK